MNKSTPEVDGYPRKNKKRQEALAESQKDHPWHAAERGSEVACPMLHADGKNVVLLGAFKEFCALSFVKGALLKDPKGLLLKPGENTQAGRWFKFTNTGSREWKNACRRFSTARDWMISAPTGSPIENLKLKGGSEACFG